jgi:hypothetical protein
MLLRCSSNKNEPSLSLDFTVGRTVHLDLDFIFAKAKTPGRKEYCTRYTHSRSVVRVLLVSCGKQAERGGLCVFGVSVFKAWKGLFDDACRRRTCVWERQGATGTAAAGNPACGVKSDGPPQLGCSLRQAAATGRRAGPAPQLPRRARARRRRALQYSRGHARVRATSRINKQVWPGCLCRGVAGGRQLQRRRHGPGAGTVAGNLPGPAGL